MVYSHGTRDLMNITVLIHVEGRVAKYNDLAGTANARNFMAVYNRGFHSSDPT